MCGIAGLMVKKEVDIGKAMLDMLLPIKHRGSDATGAGLYFGTQLPAYRVRISLAKPETDLELAKSIVGRCGSLRDYYVQKTSSPYYVLRGIAEVPEEQVTEVIYAINAEPTLCVHSFSRNMEIIKDIGTARNLERYPEMKEAKGTHAIGHTRLATESIDNVNFGHPLAAALMSELSIVHNGQLTNYYRLRRQLESKGVQFKTYNDSELVVLYLAYQMAVRGLTFREALELSVEAFDGVFSYLAATRDAIGAVRDRLGLKPILYVEQGDVLLLGSEQCSIEAVNPDVFAEEISPGEVRVWSRQ